MTTMTTMTTKATTSGAADAELEKRSGEGSEDPSPSPSRHGGARPGAGRKKGTKRKKEAEPEPISDEEIEALAFLGGTLWDISGRIFKFEALTDSERLKLGEAMAPVVRKYMPAAGEYAPEINLVVLVVGLVGSKRIKKAPATAEDAIELNPPSEGGQP